MQLYFETRVPRMPTYFLILSNDIVKGKNQLTTRKFQFEIDFNKKKCFNTSKQMERGI